MIRKDETLFLLVDVQGKLARIVHDSESTIQNIQTLIKAMKLFEIPILSVEQNPNGLGSTIEEISDLIEDFKPIKKMTFSAWGEKTFQEILLKAKRKNIVVVGIETHVCVYQTSVDLVQQGFHVILINDAVSSRTIENKELAVQKLSKLGAEISSTEMVLFELQKTCDNDKFKQLLALIK